MNERDTFLKSQGVVLITDKSVGDSLVVLHRNSTDYGYSILTVSSIGGLRADTASAPKTDSPILVMTQLTGTSPFAVVVIQDGKLAAQTHAVEMEIDSQNRLSATTEGRSGVILLSPSPVKDWSAVTLYNAQGQVIYRQDHHAAQYLRIANAGKQNIVGLYVLFPGPTSDAAARRITFGDLPVGQTTKYVAVPNGVYRYAAYAYTLDGREVVQPVTDWLGESPMTGTRFTYRITLDVNKPTGAQVELLGVSVDVP